MDQIIEMAIELFDDFMIIVNDFLLLFAGLGLTLFLLILWLIFRKRNHSDDDSELLEVGSEPVIVYRKAAEQQQEEPPKMENVEEPEPEKLPPEPVPSPPTIIETDPVNEADGEPVPLPQIENLPRINLPEATMDPEPEPEPIPDPKAQIKPRLVTTPAPPSEPLPYLESELANDTLFLFSHQGFQIEKIVYQGKYGADLIVTRPGARVYVHVKEWKKKITDSTVQEVYNYAKTNDCNQVIIVASSSFLRNATKVAARMNVILWSPKTIKKLKNKPLLLGYQDIPPTK